MGRSPRARRFTPRADNARAAAVAQQHRETEEEDHQDVACQISQTHGMPPLPK